MRSPHPGSVRWLSPRAASLLAAACCAAACAGPGGAPRPASVEIQETGGFTITEAVRANGAARADFDSALRALAEGHHEDAIASLVAVTEAVPAATSAHIDLAIAYRETNDLASAEASLERALALNPRHPVALNELGIVYRRTGRLAEARQAYEEALGLHPSFHFARRNLAILCDLYLRDDACALESYQLYLQVAPGDESAAMWLADVQMRVGR